MNINDNMDNERSFVYDDDVSIEDNCFKEEKPKSKKVGRGRRGKKKVVTRKNPQKGLYKNTNMIKEDHGKPVFGVSFNHYTVDGQPHMFATVGSNRVTVYECREAGYIKLIAAYADSDPDENYYSCAWTIDVNTGCSLLAFAGYRGVIRLLNVSTRECVKHYISHASAINELKFHPTKPHILLSASKDHSLRVWNIRTDVLICIFEGVEGHRDEVLSCDFNQLGDKLISCGMDHSLKVWKFDTEEIKLALQASDFYDGNSKNDFPTQVFNYPYYSTRDVHKNYVDCVRWFGDSILSRSCKDNIVLWKPGEISTDIDDLKAKENNLSIICRLETVINDFWYMRFALDYNQKYIAFGNHFGKITVWDLQSLDPLNSNSKSTMCHLQAGKCNTTIRQTAFSKDSSILISVCEDSSIWRWDLNNK